MKINNNESIKEFLIKYKSLHDSNITNINYDITNSKLEMSINVFWSGEPVLKEDNTYETNKTKINLIFKGIEKLTIKEIESFDYIEGIKLEYIKLNNKDYINFVDNYEIINIICEELSYEEIK